MRVFSLTWEEENGMQRCIGKNDGFSAIEILGFLEWKKLDIMKQIEGEIKPDIVKRELVKDSEA